MREADDSAATAAPPIELGADPDNPRQMVTLPDGALESGCYIEGPETHEQTALLHSWCVQFAAAGCGFCYVAPRSAPPMDLLARLPANRLDDVVWIDVDRKSLPSHLEIPWLERVTIDLFDRPALGHEAFIRDPIDLRVNAYLDALSTEPAEFDWNIARALSGMLPALIRREELTPYSPESSLALPALEELRDAKELSPAAHEDLEIAFNAVMGVRAREDRSVADASRLLGMVHDPTPTNPLLYETTYDIARALSDDQIVLVAGNLDAPNDIVRLRSHLIVAALWCRLWEAATIDADSSSSFPLVVDGFDDLVPGDGTVFQRLIRAADTIAVDPIMSGPPTSDLPESLSIAIGDEVDTRIVVTDRTTSAPDEQGQESGLSSALMTASLDAVERYLDREASGAVAEGPLCWLRTDDAGLVGDTSHRQRDTQPAFVPTMPEPRHGPDEVAAALRQSLHRHGTEADYVTDDIREESITRVKEHGRQSRPPDR